MDGRDGMSSFGSGSYYIHRGIHGSVSGSGSGSGSGAVTNPGLHVQSGFTTGTNANISEQSSVRDNNSLGSASGSGPAFHVDNSSANFVHGFNMNMDSSSVPSVEPEPEPEPEPVKKKRGRPRKYVPDDGSNMALALTPLSTKSSVDGGTPRKRGRPAGTGRKQRLSTVGEWMSSSAGLAFTPHIMNVESGENVAMKIMLFSQQRSRAVCILSGTGIISSVTLRHHSASSSTSNNVTYEGRFQIVCLSGSYLVAESGGPQNRTGGLSVSLCSSDGDVIGGEVGDELIAKGPVEVVMSSFVYGGTKPKEKVEAIEFIQDQSLQSKSDEISPNNLNPSTRNPEMDIDLMRG